MQIEHLEICNFLSYEHAEICLKDRGLILVEGENRDQGGSNGAGKSTIFEAICWGLFGTLNNGLRGDDVVRFGSGGNVRVALTLDVDGQRIFVARHRKHPKFQNQLHLEINGEDSRAATDRATQLKLLKILHLDWNTFISVALFPQGRKGIASWTDADQKSVLDTILDLDRFRKGRERVMEMLTVDQAREQKLSIEQREAKAAQSARTDGLKTLREQQALQLEEKARRLAEREEDLAQLKLSKPEENPALQKRVEELERKLHESRQEDVLNVIQQAEVKLRCIQQSLSADQARADMIRRQHVEVIDPDTEAAKHANCPSCGQNMPEEATARLLCTLKDQADAQLVRREQLQDELKTLEERIEKHRTDLEGADHILRIARESLVDVSGIEEELRSARSDVQEMHGIVSGWNQSVQQATFSVEQQRAAQDIFLPLIEEAEEVLRVLAAKIDLQEKELGPLREDIQALNFWKKGFGNQGVKSLLMSTVTPYLNARANIYMAGLSNETAVIEISTQKQNKGGEFRDKFDFKVAYPNAGNIYQGRSGGETRRADISILFALGDLATTRAAAPIKLRLLDEPFEALDALGCEQVVSLLTKHVVPVSGTVLVMSHNESMKSLFERRILVIKENGISRIVDEAA